MPRKRYGGCSSSPATACVWRATARRACRLEAGFDEHLVKPVDPEALDVLIARAS